jgi:hypothetical protein
MIKFYVKPTWLLFLFLPLMATSAYGQTLGIGTATPNASAVLDLAAPGQGLLIPRMSGPNITAIAHPAKGLMVYDSVSNQLMINIGSPSASNWKVLALSNPWKLKGNAGTNPAVDFLGTSDDHALHFGINKFNAGSIDSALNNSFFGFRSGDNNRSGSGNTGFGYNALDSNTQGSWNTAFGQWAMLQVNGQNSTYGRNTAMGAEALIGNRFQSTAVGYEALASSTAGFFVNSGEAFGAFTFPSGTFNGTAFGATALQYYSGDGSSNALAIGNAAMFHAGKGDAIAIGFVAFSDGTALNSIAIGDSALSSCYTCNETIAIGRAANASTSGNFNIGIGSDALFSSIDDSNSIGIGYMAGFHGGEDNTSIGFEAHAQDNQINTSQNTAIGCQALYGNVFGVQNTALGLGAMQRNGGGYHNVAIGVDALYNNSEGRWNVAAGANALYANRYQDNAMLGNQNTAVGANALFATSRSIFNTAIGYNAGYQYDASDRNTIIGANCDLGANNLTNCTAVGQAVTCTASNQVRIGNPATGSIGGYADWGVLSDGRMKKEIRTQKIGIDFIMRLRPITYQLDLNALDAHLNHGTAKMTSATDQREIAQRAQVRHTGFVAQEVEEAAARAGYDFSGLEKPTTEVGTYGLRYSNFVSPIVRAIQEQQQALQELQADQATVNDLVAAENLLYQQILTKLTKLEGKPGTPKN